MHELHYISLAVNTVNVIILSILLYIYSKNMRHIKSKYNIGLIIFSAVFLIENLIIIHLSIFSWFYIDPIVMAHMILIDTIELVGLLTLLYVTWE